MGRLPLSGYCLTCRKRRVKCDVPADKGRPNCGRCISSGHTCGGYELPLRVKALGVHAEHDGTRRLVKISTSQPSTSRTHWPLVLVPSPNLALPLHRDHQHTSSPYFFAKYSWGPLWRPLILSVTTSEFPEVNRVCFRAITYAYTGISRGDTALTARGRALYGQVLREVQSLLLEGSKLRLAELCSTMVLMDIMAGSAPPHHVGIANILRHCGPEIFQDEKLLVLYRSCRVLLQKRCFLEEEPWKIVPWQQVPKTFEDRLMDIIVDLPGLAEAVADPHKRAASLDKIQVLSVALQVWRWDWHSVHSGSVRMVRHADNPSEPGNPEMIPFMVNPQKVPFLVSLIRQAHLEFESPRLALDILYYNAALLYLMQLEAVAHGQPPQQREHLSLEDERYVRLQGAALMVRGANPLLLPGKAKFRCQAAAEAFMTLSCTTRLLGTTPTGETVVTPMVIGIIYWVLREQLQLGEDGLASLLSKHAFFHDAERVFEGFHVTAR
ncbi:hypothetical protein CHGG_06044 [Chaetomium globosum CBS 148.51]|uniref:Zn(2)-C6 fungal-type domain-containing protein n=1 Tax=Chaetomium globosum (strain ATCC 6205 / CBS 148.51 / DSM 1962 / NBRC 6347 / NRRL 1970) TaxID=306901 RepID=Q2H5M1_CHAGB|nr:uncharacterized protein CHGG_06044 [Chaetomium globosum CBS 148.51]EAQ89425.1 hypothetical protein CHGG_06044 [Chaetomium globosum CBS 148.51]